MLDRPPVRELSSLPPSGVAAGETLVSLQRSGLMRDRALALYVNSALFAEAATEFRRTVLTSATPKELESIAALRRLPQDQAVDVVFPAFARFVLARYHDRIARYRALVQTADLRAPHAWFPLARALRRKIVYHAGPTNSGKTYSALQAMRAAGSGVYCGPLRLLAMEVYDRLNAEGTYCDLVTGQERQEIPGSAHVACTVEMSDMQRRVDVAVIDEIQMIGDESRGWAWTRALMGLPATEIHLCGDGSAVDLVRSLAKDMGEEFELRTYERFTNLELEDEGLGDSGYSAIRPGDCIVAFSRRDIFRIKQEVEEQTRHRCCVIYGALPPETRRQQAQLFNTQGNKYSVLVASDAVGMGLNLNIGRVVFHSLYKRHGGRQLVPVPVPMVKQIAGRAGRRSSRYPIGRVTYRERADGDLLVEALNTPLGMLVTPKAGLFPEFEHLEVFAGQQPETSFGETLSNFARHAVLDSSFFLCKQDGILSIAAMLAETRLSLRDMYTFCMAPAGLSDLHVMAALLQFARAYASGQPVVLDLPLPRVMPSNAEELRRLETAHAIVNLWLWLSYRFEEEAFPGREQSQALAAEICDLLHRGLRKVTRLAKTRTALGMATPTKSPRGRKRPSGRASRQRQVSAPPPPQTLDSAHRRLLARFEEDAQLLAATREDLWGRPRRRRSRVAAH